MADDTFQRFVKAQEWNYATALEEIRNARKHGHWIWYIFPQVIGLGFSQTSRHYAIRDREEADAYLHHPVLGPRLVEISRELLHLGTDDATAVFGSPDDLKLRSCMTLFSAVPDADPVFQAVLDKYFSGVPDSNTLKILSLE